MYKRKLKDIIKNYGVKAQIKYWATEVQELNEAIIEYEMQKSKEQYEHIVEELADNLVMLNQIRYFYNIDEDKIVKIMKQKIDRQIERIKNENNIRN